MGTIGADEKTANIRHYMQWLEREKGLHFTTPDEVWAWSVDKIEDFWASLWDYFSIKASKPYETVLVERKMPGAQWFPRGTQLRRTRFPQCHEQPTRRAFQVRSAASDGNLVG